MLRRISWPGLILGAVCLVQCGCDTTKPWFRKKDTEEDPHNMKAVDSEADSIKAVDSDGKKKPEPFFKSNRPSGGWSSEARSIEADLGVH
jgi:hypothetical protein